MKLSLPIIAGAWLRNFGTWASELRAFNFYTDEPEDVSTMKSWEAKLLNAPGATYTVQRAEYVDIPLTRLTYVHLAMEMDLPGVTNVVWVSFPPESQPRRSTTFNLFGWGDNKAGTHRVFVRGSPRYIGPWTPPSDLLGWEEMGVEINTYDPAVGTPLWQIGVNSFDITGIYERF